MTRPLAAPAPADAQAVAVTRMLERLPILLDAQPDLIARGRMLTIDFLLGVPSAPLHVSISAGRISEIVEGPALMRSWRFAYRASAEAFSEHWRHEPRPGWHDLLALTKRGAASLEGDLHPFLTHLQYFKDLLALPRGRFAGEPT